jgi:hypothetical protein
MASAALLRALVESELATTETTKKAATATQFCESSMRKS